MFLVNLPISGIMEHATTQLTIGGETEILYGGLMENAIKYAAQLNQYGVDYFEVAKEVPGGLFYYLYYGNKLGIFPPLIFMVSAS